jgi:hypothetical protein
MYGIINKSIEELVTEKFGENKWQEVKKISEIDIDFFMSHEPYDDAITYDLAIGISKVMNISLDAVLFTFGEWWILDTTKKKYGGLLKSGGDNLKEFLVNLPQFHNHIMLMYPKLTPPEFKVSDINENDIVVHYMSKRPGLQEFVRGLFSGLGKLYKTSVTIDLLQSRNDGSEHEAFKISW